MAYSGGLRRRSRGLICCPLVMVTTGGILTKIGFRRRTKFEQVLENSSLIQIHEIIPVNSYSQASIHFNSER